MSLVTFLQDEISAQQCLQLLSKWRCLHGGCLMLSDPSCPTWLLCHMRRYVHPPRCLQSKHSARRSPGEGTPYVIGGRYGPKFEPFFNLLEKMHSFDSCISQKFETMSYFDPYLSFKLGKMSCGWDGMVTHYINSLPYDPQFRPQPLFRYLENLFSFDIFICEKKMGKIS